MGLVAAPWLCSALLLGCVLPVAAQQSGSNMANTVVPPLVNFSGTLTDLNGKPLTGVVGVTFYLYKDQEGGAALWMETQNVQPNKVGRYTVTLGSTSSYGLPADIFVAGEARWLGVQPQGQAEQRRVLLLSVPYALKAGDAETIGGLPPSAFVLAAPANSNGAGATTPSGAGQPLATGSITVTTAGGTLDFVPNFDATPLLNTEAVRSSGCEFLPPVAVAVPVAGRVKLAQRDGTEAQQHGRLHLCHGADVSRHRHDHGRDRGQRTHWWRNERERQPRAVDQLC
jgi:hypothetical protein